MYDVKSGVALASHKDVDRCMQWYEECAGRRGGDGGGGDWDGVAASVATAVKAARMRAGALCVGKDVG